jgi:hypothetical protein
MNNTSWKAARERAADAWAKEHGSFVDEVVRRLPFRVLVIQTDNGAEFQSNFHWHLEEHDIRHVYIRPNFRKSPAPYFVVTPPFEGRSTP